MEKNLFIFKGVILYLVIVALTLIYTQKKWKIRRGASKENIISWNCHYFSFVPNLNKIGLQHFKPTQTHGSLHFKLHLTFP